MLEVSWEHKGMLLLYLTPSVIEGKSRLEVFVIIDLQRDLLALSYKHFTKPCQNAPLLAAGMNGIHTKGDVRGTGCTPFPPRRLRASMKRWGSGGQAIVYMTRGIIWYGVRNTARGCSRKNICESGLLSFSGRYQRSTSLK